MIRIIKFSIILLVAISLVGCKKGELPLLNRDTQLIQEDEELKYKIDQVVLSKGYQSIEPKVEIVKKNNDIKLLVSAGLLESSGIYIDQIVKKGNAINIHVYNENDKNKLQLAVPQIMIELKNSKLLNLEDLKFNIINENYKPIAIKLGVNEVINKVKADFKVSANTSPILSLSKIDDRFVWNIAYDSIFDKDNPETPLINLSVEIDANTNEILKSTKGFISSYIDDGHILDYVTDKYILYKKPETDVVLNSNTENLWFFDINKNERTLLYSSNKKISTAQFSPDYKNISLVEGTESNLDLYIIAMTDKKAYKVLFTDSVVPKIIRWKDKNDLLIIDSDGKQTNIYNYNTKNNETDLEYTLAKNIIGFRILKDNYIIVESVLDSANKKISYTRDFDNYSFIDNGFNSSFIDQDMIAYIKKNEKQDIDTLHIYDLKNMQEYDVIDLNISSYALLPDDELFIVEKNQNNNDFTIFEYNIKDKEIVPITKVNSDKLFYNKKKNLVYVDLIIPFESEKSEIIYSIDLSKLTSIKP